MGTTGTSAMNANSVTELAQREFNACAGSSTIVASAGAVRRLIYPEGSRTLRPVK